MSRTYRRTKPGYNFWCALEHFIRERDERGRMKWASDQVLLYPHGSEGYRKGKAVFHSDAASNSCRSGPSWFHNMFGTRPLRRAASREIHKYFRNPDHEVVLSSTTRLPYWM